MSFRIVAAAVARSAGGLDAKGDDDAGAATAVSAMPIGSRSFAPSVHMASSSARVIEYESNHSSVTTGEVSGATATDWSVKAEEGAGTEDGSLFAAGGSAPPLHSSSLLSV